PNTLLDQRGGGEGGHLVGGPIRHGCEYAELVATHPVGAPVPDHHLGQAASQAVQHGVACGVPEAVVVLLEAVEVEEREDGLVPVRGRWRGLDVRRQCAAAAKRGGASGERRG